MINNNFDLIESLKNPIDYDEYSSACIEKRVEVLSYDRFCLGIVSYNRAKKVYPNLPIQEAYMKVFQNINAKAETIQAEEKEKAKTEPLKKESCCGGGKKKSPSMIRKARNYAKTMARWIKAGRPVVSLSALAQRLSICGKCESLIKDRECSECGCPMIVKAEMDIDRLCELNKW